MTIAHIYQTVFDIINKHQGGYLSADEFNRHFRNAELHHMDFLIGELRRYQYGRPVPNVGIGMSKKINEALAPFRKTIAINTGTTGEVPKPNNVAIAEAMYRVDGVEIRPVQAEELGEAIRNSVVKIENNPRYVEYNTYWMVYPNDMGSGIATVIENPPYSKYAITVNASGREEYDSVNSVDPIWKNGDVVEIIGRMIKTIGVNLKDGELMQYAQSIINQGE